MLAIGPAYKFERDFNDKVSRFVANNTIFDHRVELYHLCPVINQ